MKDLAAIPVYDKDHYRQNNIEFRSLIVINCDAFSNRFVLLEDLFEVQLYIPILFCKISFDRIMILDCLYHQLIFLEYSSVIK